MDVLTFPSGHPVLRIVDSPRARGRVRRSDPDQADAAAAEGTFLAAGGA
jgi:hypothetical protein